MIVAAGQTVKLRDGRIVYVTDAADQDPDAYRVYSIDAYTKDGSFVVKAEMPVESIFVGNIIDTEVTVVSDMSEIVSIIE